MVQFVVVKLLNGSGIVQERALLDTYEGAVAFIESSPEKGIFSIEKRWYN